MTRTHPVYGPDHEKEHNNLWCAQCASAWDGSEWAEQQATAILETESGRAGFALAYGLPLPEEMAAAQQRIAELEANYAAQEKSHAKTIEEYEHEVRARREAEKRLAEETKAQDEALACSFKQIEEAEHQASTLRAALVEAQDERDGILARAEQAEVRLAAWQEDRERMVAEIAVLEARLSAVKALIDDEYHQQNPFLNRLLWAAEGKP
jgi:hypothetical protein